MASLKIDEILELLETGKFNPRDIVSGGGKSRLRRILSSNKYQLTENQVESLWRIHDIRWDIVRRVNLSSEMKKKVASDKLTKATMREFMRVQDFNDTELKELIDQIYDTDGYFHLWALQPEKMLEKIGFDELIKRLEDGISSDTIREEGPVLECMLSVSKADNQYLKQFLEMLKPGIFYMPLAKQIYFDDDCVDIIIDRTKDGNEMLYAQVMEILITKGNLSIHKKAKYLLEKY